MQRSFPLILLLVILGVPSMVLGQYQKPYKLVNSGLLYQRLQESQTLGTALYLAAHPDDESTELMAYLANERGLRTAYLSLTRGDGGQNLLGSEKGAQLGILRTQELLGARSVDRGHQFFTRANDFGYSKSTTETLQIWDKERVLADIVRVIRKLQPDVIITRFPAGGYEGAHGHHTASATLAKKSFDAAGNPEAFADQLKQLDTWQPKRLLFHTSPYFYRGEDKQMDTSKVVTSQLAQLNPATGKTYVEMGAISQTYHKSQGFGSAPRRGSRLAYLKHTKGQQAKDDLLDGINTDWSRVEGGGAVQQHLQRAEESYDPGQPSQMVPHLLKAYKALQDIDNEHWRQVKSHNLKNLILAANGCLLNVSAKRGYGVPGEKVKFTANFLKRGSYPMKLDAVTFPFQEKAVSLRQQVERYNKIDTTLAVTIPQNLPFTQPYWLREPMTSKGMYSVPEPDLIGLPETPSPVKATYQLEVGDLKLKVDRAVKYRYEDRIKGEVSENFEIGPPATMALNTDVIVFPDNKPQKLTLTVKAHQSKLSGNVSLDLPGGFKVVSKQKTQAVSLAEQGATQRVTFQIAPPTEAKKGSLTAQFTNDDGTFTKELTTINYDHIPKQTLFPQAKAKLLRLDIRTPGKEIGYIMGSGDEVPKALRQLGYKVVMINEENIAEINLNQFDALITGVRTYNTQEWINNYQDKLMRYVLDGGTMVSQYNKDDNLVVDQLGPYSFTIAYDRVTKETAKVNFLKPDHPILNTPNKIGKRDFNNWVQERGLYFPGEWNKNYTPILSSHDPNESPKKGGLLVAEYGDGHYIYTGYAFFRQLPSGVPGAYRLFTNLIAYD